MRMIPNYSGPFSERPYFEKCEIETIATDELRNVDLLPEEPAPIRIERFIEKRFRIAPDYRDLPPGLLGLTKFGANGSVEIVISTSLSEDGDDVSARRLNSTLAHEAGHALLHRRLFSELHLADQTSALTEDIQVDRRRILCRTVDERVSDRSASRSTYSGQWWEYQANLMIGALLMPRPLVRDALVPLLTRVGMLGIEALSTASREPAARTAAEIFDVNPVVARIRINEVFPPNLDDQLTL